MPIPYPEGLPCALRENYSLQTVSPLMRTQLESGRARQRRRFTNVPTMAQVSWNMSPGQGQIFEGWFRWLLKDGAEWATIPLKTPSGLADYECRFTDIYQGPTPIGADKWRYTAELEIMERQTLPQDWIELGSDFILNADLFDLALNQEWPEA